MKTSFLCFFILFASCVLNAQDKVKFGDVSKEELSMTTYENDPEAAAVVLYEERSTWYDFVSTGELQVSHKYHVRIKILTDEGLDYANRTVSTYIGRTRAGSESLSGLSGNTFNLENGKVEKIQLSKAHIFEEKVSDRRLRTKFTFQSVKPGSVIEYRYEIKSPIYAYLPDVVFQRSIPVKYSKYELIIPEYFTFNRDSKGYEPIKYKGQKENQMFVIGTNRITSISEKMLFETENLPGLKNENYVWSLDDFMTRVSFELQGITIPGSVYKQFSNTWTTVATEMLGYSNFGKQFNHKLFKDDFATLIKPEMDEKSKLRAIYNMVRSKVKWNDVATVWANDPKDALKKGLGTSGEINALLICALREAGYDAYPVAMSRRHEGRISFSHPTIDDLRYFIVGCSTGDGTVYMDAAAKFGDLDVLPIECMSDFARSIRPDNLSDWINLTAINSAANRHVINVLMEFDADGVLSGNVTEILQGEVRYGFRTRYDGYKDQDEYLEKRQSDEKIQITDFKVEGTSNADERTALSFKFTKDDVILGDDHIYMNPILVPVHGENPFKAEQRRLPVEFSYPTSIIINANVKIPEGYAVEELPKPQALALNDADASFVYRIQEDGNGSIVVRLRYDLKKILYSQPEYEHLRDFYTHLVNANISQVVLKKVK